MLKIVACVASQHDFGLVAVSAGICLLGCFSTVTLMANGNKAEIVLARDTGDDFEHEDRQA
jgi:NO-binding membrane sensor protein with MHYT domain